MIRSFLLFLLFLAGSTPTARAGLTFTLNTSSQSSATAEVAVGLDFTAASPTSGPGNDSIDGIQLGVSGSDQRLTFDSNGNPDYGRFNFTLNSALAGFTATPFSPEGSLLIFANDPAETLMPGLYALGTLSIDLAGLDLTSPLLVSLGNGDPGFQTDASGTFNGEFTPSFDALGLVAFEPRAVNLGGAVSATPEPATLIHLVIASGIGLIVTARRRRKQRVRG